MKLFVKRRNIYFSKRHDAQEQEIPKRHYRTAFDAFGENNLIVWSNGIIHVRTCEDEGFLIE